MTESFDRAAVRELVEDHWRAKIRIRGYGRRAKNTELMHQMTNQFADQMEALAEAMPPAQGKEFMGICLEEMRSIAAEFKRSFYNLARRLEVLPGSVSRPGNVSHRQGIGEMAVRTAVRASIWATIFRLFR
jgi:hypothetical protein